MEKVQLSSAHSWWKLSLALLFLGIGVVAFVHGFMQLLSAESGWRQIEAASGQEVSCAQDFVLDYDLGAGETSATVENKAISRLYGQACVDALQLFSNSGQWPERHNIRYLNEHPNETVTVEPGLYKALETLAASGDRTVYLGPIYELYNNIFSCQDDVLTAELDPRQDEDTRQYFADCAAFADDPAAISLEMLGEGQVRLNVSEAYMDFAREQQIESFVDLCWMENAFIIDYLADVLTENGYINGVLSSYDGFLRALGGASEQFGTGLYDLADGQSIPAASLSFGGEMSMVYLHGHPLGEQDSRYYYEFADGRVCTAYLDPADGLCKNAVEALVGFSRSGGCAETLLRLIPVYVADKFRADALDDLAAEGIYTAFCQDRQVLCNAPDVTVSGLYDADGVRYTVPGV